MQWIIAGLGNPGKEYAGTRHNAGREMLMAIEKKKFGKADASVGSPTLRRGKVTFVYPDVYMNNSGGPIKKLVSSKKAAEGLVVVHDDLDLPLGRAKISFGASAGGHNGVLSIQKALKTKDFIRIRIGISPATPGGKLKKPDASGVVDFVLGTFKPAEQEKLKKVRTMVAEALKDILTEGREVATMHLHSR